MRTGIRLGVGVSLFLWICAPGRAAAIEGEYLEARSADVYTGPCFANGEVGLRGNQAILAWKVRQGTWNGVPLDGLSVVGVVRAGATLGDSYHDPYPAQAVVFVDRDANAAQQQALVEFARSMGGRLFDDIVAVQAVSISMQQPEHGSAVLTAGSLVSVRTRALSHKDHFCGNEVTYYPPLVRQLSHSMPAVAVANEYSGGSLGTQWRLYNRRSAFVGTFASDAMPEITQAK